MTREETIEAIKVMQAWVDGKSLQSSAKFGNGVWHDLSFCSEIGALYPTWDWDKLRYRIKPKPLEVWHWISDETRELDLPRDGYLSKEECESHHSGRYSASGKALRFVAQED